LLTRLAVSFGSGDYAAIRSYIASAYFALSSIAFLLLALLIGIWFLIKTEILSIGGLSSRNLGIVFSCFLVFIVSIPLSVIQRIFYAQQKAWLANLWTAGGALFSVILCIAAIHVRAEPAFVVLAYSMPAGIALALSSIGFFRSHPTCRPRLNSISREVALDLVRVGSLFFVLSVLTSVALNVDNVLIAAFRGSSVVAEYSVPSKLASVLSLIVTTLFLPLWAANGEALSRHDYAWVRKTARKMSIAGGIFLTLAGLSLTFSGNFIINLWMHRGFPGQTEILAGFCALAVVMAIASPFNMILNGAGIVLFQVKIWMIFLFVSVALKYFLLSNELSLWLIPVASVFAYGLIVASSVIFRSKKELAMLEAGRNKSYIL